MTFLPKDFLWVFTSFRKKLFTWFIRCYMIWVLYITVTSSHLLSLSILYSKLQTYWSSFSPLSFFLSPSRISQLLFPLPRILSCHSSTILPSRIIYISLGAYPDSCPHSHHIGSSFFLSLCTCNTFYFPVSALIMQYWIWLVICLFLINMRSTRK